MSAANFRAFLFQQLVTVSIYNLMKANFYDLGEQVLGLKARTDEARIML